MNLSNKLTILRILLVPFLIFCLLSTWLPYRFVFSLLIFALASFTDHLDGKIARKKNQVTDFGKFLDPLADKMLITSILLCFVSMNIVQVVPVIIILMRDFMVTSLRLVACKNNKVISANFWGKLKTAFQMVTIIFILLTQSFLNFKQNILHNEITIINYCNNFFIWISAILTIISGIVYITQNFYVIKNSK